MRITIQPVNIDGVDCTEADMSLSIGNGVAVRVVPVGPDGEPHGDLQTALVGRLDDARFQPLLTAVREAAATLLGA